jgi:phosphorylated CTD-interacting factor 1
VFFLQTTNGARRWPVTDEVRGELKAAMARAVGSARTVKDLERRYRGKPGRGDRPGDRPGDQPGAGFPKEKLRIEIRDDARNGDARAGDDGGEGGDKKRRRRRRKHE